MQSFNTDIRDVLIMEIHGHTRMKLKLNTKLRHADKQCIDPNKYVNTVLSTTD